MTDIDPPPRAASIQIWSCGHCPHPHVLLLDESGRRIAEVLLSSEHIASLNSFRYAQRHNELPQGRTYCFLPRSTNA